MTTHQYVYAVPTRQELGDIDDARLSDFTERHRIALTPRGARAWSNPAEEMRRSGARGVVLEMVRGWPASAHLRLARKVLAVGGRVFFYWPREEAIECIDPERLGSYWRLWFFLNSASFLMNLKRRLRDALPGRLIVRWIEKRRNRERHLRAAAACSGEISQILAAPAPNAMKLGRVPAEDARLPGVGIYLRTDYWAKISSGGSYGHTCYVAKELAATTEKFVAYTASRYTMLDELGVRQVAMPPAADHANEYELLCATRHYYEILRRELEASPPQYIYERTCLGNYAGARLSHELRIPYIVEYNGSEISMARSFSALRFAYEDVYLEAEMAAFRQATAISVISAPVRDDLVKRGIEPAKILVNPNGVDVDAYAPPAAGKRAALRRELGFDADDRVICFTGTFGGWHGVEVLAAAIPRVLDAVPAARFLLIGDGNYKHLVDKAIKANGIQRRVKCVGRVPQTEGARLLGAADVYVSPHSSHMVDSRFFGSPTKIFEYMAMGGGIVASDLEQIGEVLAPGLRADRLPSGPARIDRERAILCKPGDVEEFVAAVIYAARFPEVCGALGRNARAAAVGEYSWRMHVARLWQFVHERGL